MTLSVGSYVGAVNPLRMPVRAQPKEDLPTLAAALKLLAGARTRKQTMAIVRQAARQLTGADGATFILREGEKCYYADEDAVQPLWKGRRFPMEICVSGWAMTHHCPVAIEDIYTDSRVLWEAYHPTFVKSLAIAPIRRKNPVGAIGIYWAMRHAATAREMKTLVALADGAAVALTKTGR